MQREQIVEALTKLNLTQGGLAKICGIPNSKMNRFLRGFISLDSHELSRISSALRTCTQIESGRSRIADLLPTDWTRVVQRPALEAAVFHGENNV